MSRSRSPIPTRDSFDAFLDASDVEQLYIVLSLAEKSHRNDAQRGVNAMLHDPQAFERAALAHQRRIARQHRWVALIFAIVVLAMLYVIAMALHTPDAGSLPFVVPGLIVIFSVWRMLCARASIRRGNAALRQLLDSLDGQPFSYNAAAFSRFMAQHPALAGDAQAMGTPETMALKHLAALKHEELQLRTL